ncbi:ATP-binding protein [Thermoflavimicrobium daqui]|jgi:two-component system sensor histidine kinase VicK|uniref:histidine kinase n=1 Tax=Thermoflavimicrobium daqui TaxID=2137476 RepID=A0A364K3P4_9BACL|nr:ATP-binding protein [Thermoflavimicrobium daqui]RAL23378.1 cell wall metabolism sensor histidine kinase WalK [Thermoflavimicrobium daqui]
MKNWTHYVSRLQWKLVVIFLLLFVASVQLIGVYIIRTLEQQYITDFLIDLKTQAQMTEIPLKTVLENQHTQNTTEQNNEIHNLLRKLRIDRDMQVQVLNENGIVLSTTSPDKEEIIGRKNEYFIRSENQTTSKIRRDPIKGIDYQIYIRPIKNNNGDLIGSIYIEASLQPVYEKISSFTKKLILIGGITLVSSAFLIILLARTITSPLEEITKKTTEMATGNFATKVKVYSKDEIGILATAFNNLSSDLQKALSQKEEEKEKLESVLANMSDGVLATDRNGYIIVKNLWAEKILNRSVHIGDSLENVLALSNPISLPLESKRQTFLELNSEDLEEQTIVKITFTPIKPQGQTEMVGLIAILQDVTEEEKLDRQRKDFVANVSHELRTPLTTIKSYLEALEDGAIGEPELAMRFLKVTRQEADRMTRLIHDLLQLSRLDAKQARFNKKAINLTNMLEDVVDRFSFQCKQKNIQISLHAGRYLPHVYADRDKIDQVLDNLVSNAVKYTPDGGKISVYAKHRANGMIEVAIQDTGIGIPKKDLGRIFERFYRVDKARSRNMGGTGLGLAIAQEIVRAHDGEIWIESEYQNGTTISFTLPPCEPEVIG